MRARIFLSHNSADKPFVRRLAVDLDAQGIDCWIDEAEIKVGESLIEKICEGLDNAAYVAVILSPASVVSRWVQKEVDVAMNQEIQGRRVKILPIMYRACEVPGFLIGKKYANFTSEESYFTGLKEITQAVGLVFRESALSNDAAETNLFKALDASWNSGIPVLAKPFYRPFQYMGLSVLDAAKATGGEPNPVGNIIIDTDEVHMLLECERNYISFVSIDLKRTAPQYQNKSFDPVPALGALSINPGELEPIRSALHYHHFSDHRRKLKVSVSCLYDGAPLTVSFSSKYYGT
jgi:hypothetical protein